MNTLTSYPRFSTGQLLRSSDLNRIVDYLNEQDRLTRRMLVGIGIVCGLEIRRTNEAIVVSKGVGITSQGHLIAISQDLSFKKQEHVQLEKGALLGNDSTGIIDLFELFDGSIGTNFDPVFLKDKYLLLLFESNTVETQMGECHLTFAQTKVDVQQQVRVFLISKADLDKLPKPPVSQFLNFQDIPAIFIRRPELAEIDDVEKLKTAFVKICREAIEIIHEGLNKLWSATQNQFSNENRFKNFKAETEAKLDATSAEHPARLPLVYNYLKDIVSAYQELAQLGRVPVKINLDAFEESWFPKYLVSGKIIDPGPDEGRTPFYRASDCHAEDSSVYEKAKFLYHRLEEMTNLADFLNLGEVIKITPSSSLDMPLSRRAIPFYYQNNGIREAWNFDLTRMAQTRSIPCYFPPEPAGAPYDEPLRYDLDAWRFFRIEGHLGKPYKQALADIERQRREWNVAFDIQVIPIVETALDLQPGSCFPGIEAVYHQLLNEWEWELLKPEPSDKEKVLLSYLSFLKGTCLNETDFAELKTFVSELNSSFDECRVSFIQRLLEIQNEYKKHKGFALFAADHPGLEHQGGVMPGGTLVLVVDGENDGEIIADFNLPYLCCEKLKKLLPPEIFMCFPRDKVCNSDAPQQIFTYPSGGRMIAAVEGKNCPDAVKIDSSTGRWMFHPESIPADLFGLRDEVEAELVFLYRGKTEKTAVKIKRIISSFEVKAQPEGECTTFFISAISPVGEYAYHWSLKLSGGAFEVPKVFKQIKGNNESFDWYIDHPENVPSKAVITLMAGQNGCWGKHEETVDLNSYVR